MEKDILSIKKFIESKHFTKKSVKSYVCCLSKVFYHLGYNFTENQLENLFTNLKISGRTYNNYRAICNFYTKTYLGYEIKFTKAKVPSKLAVLLTEDEFYRMLKSMSNFKHKILLSIMYRCGLRVSEAVKVRKEDCDTKNYRLFVRQGKGQKDRITIIPKSLAYYLSKYLAKIDGFLFKTSSGHLTDKSAQNVLKQSLAKASINKKLTPHDLRRNFAINLEKKGVQVTRIQKFLGHKKLTTTQMYLEHIQDDLTDIAAIA